MYTIKHSKVIPFGPKNSPVFYTAMVQFFREDWILLFQEIKHTIVMTNSPCNIVCDDRIIINDILLFSNHVSTILHYFSCVVRAFTKYILFFKLIKRDFLQPRVVYVMILLLMVIIPLLQSLVYCKTGIFHPTASHFYRSSVCVASIIDIVPGSKSV